MTRRDRLDHDDFEERAAIMEYVGGLERKKAEASARLLLTDRAAWKRRHERHGGSHG